MPASPQKKKSVNPIGVIGMIVLGGATMVLTMLAMLFFPLAGVLGVLVDLVGRLNPFKNRKTATESAATQETGPVAETLEKT